MSYSSGILNKRIYILTRSANVDGDYGRVAGRYIIGRSIWSAVDWARGAKAMREGALDAYDVVMVRTRWSADVTRETRFLIDGIVYEIDSMHADERANTIQATCRELQGATPYFIADYAMTSADWLFKALVEDTFLFQVYNARTHHYDTLFEAAAGPDDYTEVIAGLEDHADRIRQTDDGVTFRMDALLRVQNDEGASSGIRTLTSEDVIVNLVSGEENLPKMTCVKYINESDGNTYIYDPLTDTFVEE